MKNITQKLIIFDKEDSGYLISLEMRGYCDASMCKHGPIFRERVPLGFCVADDLERQIEVFKHCNYDIEVRDTKG